MDTFSRKRIGRAGTALVAVLTAAAPSLAQEGRELTGDTTWWEPENVFPATEAIDTLFDGILYLTGGVGIAVFALLLYFLVKYRYRSGRRAIFIHGNNRVEMVWTLIPAVILVMISALSQQTWSLVKNPPFAASEEGVVEIEVVAQQFLWNFHYAGEDGIMGPRRRELINPNSGDPAEQIGLDRDAEGAADDIVTQRMVVPVNRRVFIHLTSKDVIHSFFLPNFRVKQDAVPGLVSKVWLESTKTSAEVVGRYADGSPKPFDIVCAELCGQGHFKMRGQLFVVSDQEYAEFLEEEAAFLDVGGDDGYGDYGY